MADNNRQNKITKHKITGKKVCAITISFIVLALTIATSVYAGNTADKSGRVKQMRIQMDSVWDEYYRDDEYNNAVVDSGDLDEEEPYFRDIVPRTLTPEVIPYDGKVRSISCWGDSMMYGCNTTPGFMVLNGGMLNISYATTPLLLERLTGCTTYNLGVNGETSREIATRQGGLSAVTDRDIFIEGSGIAEVKLRSEYDGSIVYMDDYSGYNHSSYNTNIVVINGAQYYMTNGNDGGSQIIYGTDVYIPAGSRVYTLAAIERSNDILVLEIGSNGGWDNDYDELIEQYDAMIESIDCKYYIIVGDTDDPELSADSNKDVYVGTGETPWETALREAYGEHFLNLRLYMIRYGLYDCGFEATDEDIIGYTIGNISQQLRSDWTHFNSFGYYSKAKAICAKGAQLGYWPGQYEGIFDVE